MEWYKINTRSYTKEVMWELIKQMSMLFDGVRLADPIAMTVYDIENGEFRQQDNGRFIIME